jgi:hypothetical protein
MIKAIMNQPDERLMNALHTEVTPDRLRAAAADAELRGDWPVVQLLMTASDRIIQLEAQNQAYRHALASGVSINLISKRKWFHIFKD